MKSAHLVCLLMTNRNRTYLLPPTAFWTELKADHMRNAQCRDPNLLMSVVAMQFYKDDATFCRDPADHVSLKKQAHRHAIVI